MHAYDGRRSRSANGKGKNTLARSRPGIGPPVSGRPLQFFSTPKKRAAEMSIWDGRWMADEGWRARAVCFGLVVHVRGPSFFLALQFPTTHTVRKDKTKGLLELWKLEPILSFDASSSYEHLSSIYSHITRG